MESSAVFSEFRTHRYALFRQWNDGDRVMFIGLNPSTADETLNDPTVRRCIGFAQAWGFGGLVMTNIFAYRATDPQVMKAQADPIGADNDAHLIRLASECRLVIAAWGTHGDHIGRGAQVRSMLPGLHALRITKGGHPAHPLYLPAALQPIVWANRGVTL